MLVMRDLEGDAERGEGEQGTWKSPPFRSPVGDSWFLPTGGGVLRGQARRMREVLTTANMDLNSPSSCHLGEWGSPLNLLSQSRLDSRFIFCLKVVKAEGRHSISFIRTPIIAMQQSTYLTAIKVEPMP